MIINPLLGKFEPVLLSLIRCFEIPSRDSFNLEQLEPSVLATPTMRNDLKPVHVSVSNRIYELAVPPPKHQWNSRGIVFDRDLNQTTEIKGSNQPLRHSRPRSKVEKYGLELLYKAWVDNHLTFGKHEARFRLICVAGSLLSLHLVTYGFAGTSTATYQKYTPRFNIAPEQTSPTMRVIVRRSHVRANGCMKAWIMTYTNEKIMLVELGTATIELG
jgi:hypothetical protein